METFKTCILIDMIRLFTFCLACIIFSSSYGQNKTEKFGAKSSTSKKSMRNFDTSKIAILNSKTNWWLIERLGSTKSFNLTDTELKEVDEVFNKCINQNHIDTSNFHYKRQYVPFIDKYGRRKVWINCFCSDYDNEFPGWKSSIVLVSDGGSCFFNVIINIKKKSFSDFEVNGIG